MKLIFSKQEFVYTPCRKGKPFVVYNNLITASGLFQLEGPISSGLRFFYMIWGPKSCSPIKLLYLLKANLRKKERESKQHIQTPKDKSGICRLLADNRPTLPILVFSSSTVWPPGPKSYTANQTLPKVQTL